MVGLLTISCFTSSSTSSITQELQRTTNTALFHDAKINVIEKIAARNTPNSERFCAIAAKSNIESVSGLAKLKDIRLPIYSAEVPKFLTLSSMMFLIIYMFTIARDTKDTLIVPSCGAESIAFLKVYGVIPAASAFLMGYSYLANRVSPEQLFYLTVGPFMLFYCAFAFILYPMRHVLHPMSIPLPDNGFSFAVNLFRHWTFSLFYIVSELWGSAGIPLLFWSCANDVVRIDQVYTVFVLNYTTID